jgi:hypothetical protein
VPGGSRNGCPPVLLNMPPSLPQSPVLRFLKLTAIAVVILFAGIFIFKDVIIKTGGARIASSLLGAHVDIDQFSWDILSQKVVIKGLVVHQPPGFGNGSFIDIPEIVVGYDLVALCKGQIHMPLVALDLREMSVVKDTQGHLNIDAIKVFHPDKKEKLETPAFQIDALRLNIGKVIYKDSFKKPVPQILVYDVHLKDKTFKNINNFPKLVTVVMMQALKPTAIQSAGLYAAATIMGIGFLPGAVLGVIVAKDSGTADLSVGAGKAFDAALNFVKTNGRVSKVNKDQGIVDGNIQGNDIKIHVEKLGWFKSRMTVSARKYMLPKKEFAAGILYQIIQGL